MRHTFFVCLFIGAISACSSSSSSSPGGTAGDASTPDPEAGVADDAGADAAPAAPFKLTSTAYTTGGAIPADQTCNGKNESPPFAWGPGPEGTKSYAIVLNDDTISFLHGIIYDIPASAESLSLPGALAKVYAPTTPAGTPAGTKQTKNYKGTFGYAGPCPTTGEHEYHFILHALDVETLPGATMATTLDEADALITKHSLKSTPLIGKYKKP